MTTVVRAGLQTPAYVDVDGTGLSVGTGKAVAVGEAAGSIIDLYDSTLDMIPESVIARFAVDAGVTNGINLDIFVQFSNASGAGTGWPADSSNDAKSQIVGTFTRAADTDITATNNRRIQVKGRYMRFYYDNNNASDSVTVASQISKDWSKSLS